MQDTKGARHGHRQAKDHALFVVRHRGGGGGEFLLLDFKDSRINQISRYGKEGLEKHGKQPGSVMVVAFELEGQKFVALNGGPQFKFSEAISFQIHCETQKEVDYFWDKLSSGGEEGPCGWLKDKFGHPHRHGH